MRPEYVDEVLYAAFSLSSEHPSIISRNQIADEIHAHPDLYPDISSKTPIYQKRLITQVMNRNFRPWNQESTHPFSVTIWSIPVRTSSPLRRIAYVLC